MSENSMQKRIFGPKRDEVTGQCKRLHNEELYDLYCSPYITRVIIKKNEVDRTCSMKAGGEWFIQGFGGET
jgi:hypothetical protein